MKTPISIASSLAIAFCAPSVVRAAGPIELRAGPVTMLFEPDIAFLRYIKAGPHEILRGITAPVRNQFWGTVLPVVSNVKVDNKGDQFTLNFDAHCVEREIDFLWHGSITGTTAGEITYTFDGTAHSTFQKNRIGFCILHGPSSAGKAWQLETVGGEKVKGHFPDFISPHQPAKDLREIGQELTGGWWAHVRMEGDTFEMEDQRNWTDASFKTYCTPLGLPYPVTVEKGSKVTQKITIRLASAGDQPRPESPQAGAGIRLTLAGGETPMPRLGLQVSSQTGSLTEIEIARLKALRLDHLRVDLEPAGEDFRKKLAEATAQAKALGVGLHAAIRPGKPGVRARAAAAPQLVSLPDGRPALEKLVDEVKQLQPPVAVWLIIGADPGLFKLARELLGKDGKAVICPAHEDVNFTQLNRFRPTPDMMDAAAYGIIPQIHAFDDKSIVETLTIQADTVRSAKQFMGKTPLYITPVTLRLQAAAQEPLPGELPSTVDPRQPTDFTAVWTLGSIKYLAEAGVQSATYYETTGWKGIMETAAGTTLPGKFPSKPGAVFPVYHVLRALADFAGGTVQRVECTDTLAVAGMAVRKDGKERLLLANLTGKPQMLVLKGVAGPLEARPLNLGSLAHAEVAFSSQPATVLKDGALTLPPHAIFCLDRASGRTPE
jgi:hypothetical protein